MTYEFERIGRIPDNEFSEQCTADMISMDTTWHHWLQDKWKHQREWWEARMGYRKLHQTDP